MSLVTWGWDVTAHAATTTRRRRARRARRGTMRQQTALAAQRALGAFHCAGPFARTKPTARVGLSRSQALLAVAAACVERGGGGRGATFARRSTTFGMTVARATSIAGRTIPTARACREACRRPPSLQCSTHLLILFRPTQRPRPSLCTPSPHRPSPNIFPRRQALTTPTRSALPAQGRLRYPAAVQPPSLWRPQRAARDRRRARAQCHQRAPAK